MKCKGIFIFKSISKKEGGNFKDSEGKEINYDASYSLKIDDLSGPDITERKFKIGIKNKDLFNAFNELEPYTRVEITFDIQLYQNMARLVPCDFALAD